MTDLNNYKIHPFDGCDRVKALTPYNKQELESLVHCVENKIYHVQIIERNDKQ